MIVKIAILRVSFLQQKTLRKMRIPLTNANDQRKIADTRVDCRDAQDSLEIDRQVVEQDEKRRTEAVRVSTFPQSSFLS